MIEYSPQKHVKTARWIDDFPQPRDKPLDKIKGEHQQTRAQNWLKPP